MSLPLQLGIRRHAKVFRGLGVRYGFAIHNDRNIMTTFGDGSEWLALRPQSLYLREKRGRYPRDRVGPRAVLDTFTREEDRQCTYKCNIEERYSNHCCRRKAINITHSECVSVVLVI